MIKNIFVKKKTLFSVLAAVVASVVASVVACVVFSSFGSAYADIGDSPRHKASAKLTDNIFNLRIKKASFLIKYIYNMIY
jgi:hypothetical protein